MERPQVTSEDVRQVLDDFRRILDITYTKKGMGSFASAHEILGCLEEELFELKDAVKDDKRGRSNLPAVYRELIDIAIVSIFGAACIKGNHI